MIRIIPILFLFPIAGAICGVLFSKLFKIRKDRGVILGIIAGVAWGIYLLSES